MTWNHDMTAAPRDGTDVLLAWPAACDTRPVIGFWGGYGSREFWDTMEEEIACDIGEDPPVAWMPLPPLPEVNRNAN